MPSACAGRRECPPNSRQLRDCKQKMDVDDFLSGFFLLLMLLPFAFVWVVGWVLLVTAPKSDEGVWMQPLGSRSWVSPNVRLGGIFLLYALLMVAGFQAIDDLQGPEEMNEAVKDNLVSYALIFLGIGTVGIRRNWVYLNGASRSESRKRLSLESAFFLMHCYFLVVGATLSTARIAQVVGCDCAAQPAEHVHAPEVPISWHEGRGSTRWKQVLAACSSPEQWCATPDWFVFCTESLPEGAPGLPCPP